MGRLHGLAALCVVCACSSSPKVDLLVDLRTDLQAGIEFREVRTELFERIPVSEEVARGNRLRVRMADQIENFGVRQRVALFSDIAPGTHALRLRLLNDQGTTFLQRIVLITLQRSSVFTVVVTRDCRGVECPDGGDPSAIACLGGECVDPRCTPETPEFCPVATCEVDVTCVAAAACAQAQCNTEGVCLRLGQNDRCMAGQWCNPDMGCEVLPDAPPDAGAADSGSDAGLTADAGADGGPTPVVASVQQNLLVDIAGVARGPAVAWSGTELGIAYHAQRTGQTRIYFSRRDSSATQVGGEVPISTLSGYSPGVTWNPDNREYAFVWLTASLGPSSLYFSRYDAGGTQLGGDTLVSSTGEASPRFLHWIGSRYGVTYADSVTIEKGYYAAIDGAGALIGSPVPVTGTGDCLCKVSAAWSGSVWGISWTNDAGHRNGGSGGIEVFFGLFDPDGVPTGPSGYASDFTGLAPAAGNSGSAHVAWGGDRFGLVWLDTRNGPLDVYFTILDESGSKLSSDVRLFSTRGGNPRPSVLWDGTRFAVAYTDGTSPNQVVYLQWVTADAVPIGDPLAISDPATGMGAPAMVWTGTSYAVVWDQDPGVIALARVTPE